MLHNCVTPLNSINLTMTWASPIIKIILCSGNFALLLKLVQERVVVQKNFPKAQWKFCLNKDLRHSPFHGVRISGWEDPLPMNSEMVNLHTQFLVTIHTHAHLTCIPSSSGVSYASGCALIPLHLQSKSAAAGSQQRGAREMIYCRYFIFGNRTVNKPISRDIPWTRSVWPRSQCLM